MSKKARLVMGYRLSSVAVGLYCNLSDGGGWSYTETGGDLSDTLVYPSGSYDGVDPIAYMFDGSGPVGYMSMTFDSETGLCSYTSSNPSGDTLLSFYSGGVTELADSALLTEMFFAGLGVDKVLTVPTGTTVTTTRPMLGCFYPSRLIVKDVARQVFTGRQSVSLSGKVYGVKLGERQERVLSVRLANAWPRAGIENELTCWQAFLAEAATGREFRYYPDVTVSSRFFAVSNPWGYHWLTARAESCDFKPVAEHDRYDQFVFDVECYERAT